MKIYLLKGNDFLSKFIQKVQGPIGEDKYVSHMALGFGDRIFHSYFNGIEETTKDKMLEIWDIAYEFETVEEPVDALMIAESYIEKKRKYDYWNLLFWQIIYYGFKRIDIEFRHPFITKTVLICYEYCLRVLSSLFEYDFMYVDKEIAPIHEFFNALNASKNIRLTQGH